MKTTNVITVPKKDLLRAVDIAAKTTLRQKGSLDYGSLLFASVMFNVKGCFTMDVIGSDYFTHTSVSVTLQDYKGEYCKFALLVEDLAPVLRRIDDQTLTIEVHNDKAVFRHSYGSFTLPIVEGDKDLYFARIDRLETRSSDYFLEVEAPFLRSVLLRLKKYVEEDFYRPVLSGVCIRRKAGKINYVGSNGHRLLRITKPDTECTLESTLLIPLAEAKMLHRIVSGEGTVKIDYSDTVCHVSTEDGIDFWFEPTDGKYPDFDKVIPHNPPHTLRIRRGLLIRTIDRMSFFCDCHGIMKAEISEGQISMTAADKDFCVESSEVLPCEYKGPRLKIGLGTKNLLAILSGMRTEYVLFHHTGIAGTGIIIEPEKKTEKESATALFMTAHVEDD